MLKYGKLINNNQIIVGIGNNEKFYKKIGFTLLDVEQGVDKNYYLKGRIPKQVIELEKTQKKNNIKKEIEEKFYNKYPLYKQCNIAIYGTKKEREIFKIYHDTLMEEYDNKIKEIEDKYNKNTNNKNNATENNINNKVNNE